MPRSKNDLQIDPEPLYGRMQLKQLTIGSLIDHAANQHGSQEVVGRNHKGVVQRSNWENVHQRACRIAGGLAGLSLARGDRVATLAWNRLPHLELYFGVTSAGHVLHTVNPRLPSAHLSFVLRDGGAKVLCIEPDLLHLIQDIAPELTQIETVLVLGDEEDLPAVFPLKLISYEKWLIDANPITSWPEIDEKSASTLCYTSGTTGNPKGVLYSHRSTVLHAMSACMADSMALTACDSIALVTPLFHVNAWGVPFAAAACGAKLALPGSALDPASLSSFMAQEQASFALGVPTVWMGFLDHLRGLQEEQRPQLSLTRVFVGGSAPSQQLIEDFRDILGVSLIQAWGMTETSPVVTVNHPLQKHKHLTDTEKTQLMTLQGRTVFGAEIRIVSPAGKVLPKDGVAAGHLQVRGHWVLDSYFGGSDAQTTNPDGWFDTGDIAQITPDGLLRLTDRAKDVIKSGGEWISSIDLENAALSFNGIAEAAVIGAFHPHWQERPLMLVVMGRDAVFSREAIFQHLSKRVARWWLPDDILAVPELPHSATGKLLKYELRQKFGNALVNKAGV